jgi:molybdopterin molybdotransferase
LVRLLSVKEAQSRIVSQLNIVSTTSVSIERANGRVLAEDIVANSSFPPFSNSSMDGFAVKAEDVRGATELEPVVLKIVADIPAGAPTSTILEIGQAARIMTGAPLPQGANAVVPIESTNLVNDSIDASLPDVVQIFKPVDEGAYIRNRGEDLQAGQRVLQTGRKLSPQDIGALAALGNSNVKVYHRPKIALFSTGDELVLPGETPGPGQIINSNSYALAALIEQHGGEVLILPIARDNAREVRDRFEEAVDSKADLILTSAGVSVGAYDFVRPVVEEQGQLDFWRVNMRPGKPLAFGSFKKVPVIGLPGNPVSAFIGFLVFVLPAIHKMAGLPAPSRRMVKAIISHPIESDGRESYLRAVISNDRGKITAALASHQGSGNLFSLVEANALLILPSGVKSSPIGSELDAWLLDETLAL